MPLPAVAGAVTVVTGASAGIGRAAAIEFARAGARLVLSARGRDRLLAVEREVAALQSERLALQADVTSDDDVRRLVEAALERFGRVDILICNAGVGLYGAVSDLPAWAMRQVFEVNFHGAVRCIQAVLPAMRRQRSGLIQIVSSVLGRRALPGYGGYCATKFALYGLAESLRLELEPWGVHVQTVYPSLTATEFSSHCLLRNPAGRSSRLTPMPAEAVARRMLAAARRGARDEVVGVAGRLLALLNGVAPGLVDEVIARAMAGAIPRPPSSA